MSLSETIKYLVQECDSIDEMNDSDTWLKKNPNLCHTVSYETHQSDDILAKRFGIPCLAKNESKYD